MSRWMKWLAPVLILLAGLAGFCAYVGYFGGPIFTQVAATGRPDPRNSGTAALLLSGDLGLRVGLGPKIVERLAAHGLPVLGVNSLTYFRMRRTPEEVRALVREATERTIRLAHGGKVILIGQSFGADMMHVGLPALPADLRSKVALVALVVPENTVDYRASPAEMLSMQAPDADALPTARLLDWVPTLCIQGVLEKDSLCPLLHLPNVKRVALPGGHPLKNDADALYRVLADAIRQPEMHWSRQ